MEWTPLPIGVENYEEIIEKGYYYVDKTLLIKDLIDLRGKVNLFTRPRRFPAETVRKDTEYKHAALLF